MPFSVWRVNLPLLQNERKIRWGYPSVSYTHLIDYRHATGLEAVFGYLYLSGQKERAVELFRAGWQA